MKKTLSVIIPVYNEESTLLECLERVADAELSINKEIIIVDDGSTDSSAKIAEKWIAENKEISGLSAELIKKENGGKGSAVKQGIKHSSGDVVIIQDADLEYNPNDYTKCINPILKGEAKVVYGSRELTQKRDYSYITFYGGGLAVTYWMNLLFNSELTDEPTCYKTYDGNLIRKILFKGNKFEWEPEITAKLLRLGFKIKEVPISYTPRHKSEGKKISWRDGISALATAFYWKFASIEKEKKSILKEPDLAENLIKRRKELKIIIGIFYLALALRLLFAIPALTGEESMLLRPDSSTYIDPAISFIQTGEYNTSLDSGIPSFLRVPGFPVLIGIVSLLGGGIKTLSIILCIIGALIPISIYKATRYFASSKYATIAALLFALNITAIANSPLILSDTLFAFLLSLQLLFFIRFKKANNCVYFFITIVIAALSTLVRPINFLWIIPAIFLLLCHQKKSIRKRLIYSVISIFIFMGILAPWMLRNHSLGAGFRLDSVQGEILFHNGAVLLGKIKKRTPSEIRKELHIKVDNEFSSNPEKYKKESEKIEYKTSLFKELVFKHPLQYLQLHFRPQIFIPDGATFFENLGITQTGRGTFDVMNKKGLIPAIKHYFDGNLFLLLLIAPLLFIVFITYLGFFFNFLSNLLRFQWQYCLMALAFTEYYLFLPGPISMPRYHLCALPMMCIMSALAFQMAKWKNKDSDNFITDDQAIMSKAINYRSFLYNLIHPYAKGNILEVGSGIGNMTQMLLSSQNSDEVKSLDCIEESDKCISILRNKLSKNKKTVNIIQGTFPDVVKNTSSKYDLIYHFNVLEHIENDKEAIEISMKLLKPDGILFMYIPAFNCLYGSMDKKLQHHRRYSKKEIKKLLEASGFNVLQMEYHNPVGFLGWFINNRVFKIQSQKSDQVFIFDKIILPAQIFISKFISFPFGQNLLVVAKTSKHQ